MLKKLSNIATLGALAYAGLSLSPGEAKAAGWFNCIPTAIFETTTQLQVSCSNNFNGNTWTAINLSSYNDGQKARFLSMFTSALLSGRFFRVYMTDTNCSSTFTTCKLANQWSLYIPL
jgi:hypothetical protein